MKNKHLYRMNDVVVSRNKHHVYENKIQILRAFFLKKNSYVDMDFFDDSFYGRVRVTKLGKLRELDSSTKCNEYVLMMRKIK